MPHDTTDPRDAHHDGDFPPQTQDQPGQTAQTRPTPDHGEESYQGHGRLAGRRALITGGDSGIGRAAAIAFAREGADVAIVHMPEEQADADETLRHIADRMAHDGHGVLPVVDPGDPLRLVGLVTQFDLLRAHERVLVEERHRARPLVPRALLGLRPGRQPVA